MAAGSGTLVMEPDKVCRLCLNEIVIKHSLLGNEFKEMLEALTSIKIDESVDLPTNACITCCLNIRFAYRVQQTILATDKKLRTISFISLDHVNVKEEPDIPEYVPTEDTEIRIMKGELGEADLTISNDCPVMTSNSKCTICGFSTPENITNHIREHFEGEQDCDDCGDTFPNINAYRNHVQEKHSEYPAIFPCDECHARFRYKSLYNIHMEKAHPPLHEPDDMDFARPKRKIRKTIKVIEPRFYPFVKISEPNAEVTINEDLKCGECNKVCFNDEQYLKHLEQHVKKTCMICNAKISKSNFNKHVVNHTANTTICHLCGVTCKNYGSLRGHLYRTHSVMKFTCEHCGKVFKKSYSKVMHIKKEHTGEKNHICETCGKSFFTHYDLSKHIKMTHLKLRPYVCEHCRKGFSSRFALRTHERQHTNVTPYKCPICGEGFRQNVSLRAHKKSKHNIVEEKNCLCKICGKAFASEWAVKSHSRLH